MSAYPGDEVFFHHQGEPRAGTVKAAGRHGCTIEHDGQCLQVPWRQVAGHKRRTKQPFKIIDAGDDGVIVADKTGRKRYIAAPRQAPDEPLTKALVPPSPRSDRVFLKSGIAGVIVGRPGRDGAHVLDDSGTLHRARWEDISNHAP